MPPAPPRCVWRRTAARCRAAQPAGVELFLSGGSDEHELSAGRQLQRSGDAVDALAFGFAQRPRAARTARGGERAPTRTGATLLRVLGLLSLWLPTYGRRATGTIRRGDRTHSAIAKGPQFRGGQCYSRVAQLRLLRLQYQCAGTSVLPAGPRLRSQVVEPARRIVRDGPWIPRGARFAAHNLSLASFGARGDWGPARLAHQPAEWNEGHRQPRR